MMRIVSGEFSGASTQTLRSPYATGKTERYTATIEIMTAAIDCRALAYFRCIEYLTQAHISLLSVLEFHE